MKKVIATATFLAASVALTNAATVLTVDTATLKSNGGEYTVTESIGSGSYGDFSVSIVFDTDQLNTLMKTSWTSSSSKKNLINVQNSSSTLIGVKIDGYSTSGAHGLFGSWTTSLTTQVLTEDAGNGNNKIGAESTSDGTGLNTFFTSNEVTAAALTFTVSSEGTKVYLTLKTSSDGSGGTTTLIGTNSGLKTNTFSSISKICYDSALVTYLTVDDTVLTEESAKSQNEKNLIAVPEPSAFGLLAGIGAIALAVSRRRRGR